MTNALLLVVVVLLITILVRKHIPQDRLNLRLGVLRLWLVVSALWTVGISLIDKFDPVVLIPPIVLGVVLGGVVWVWEGFKLAKTSKSEPRRIQVIANGLLFRFTLADGLITVVPSMQLFQDAMRDAALESALEKWRAGVNGPLDSLDSQPSVRDYLYTWAVDRTRWASGGVPMTSQRADERAVWVSPDLETVWYWMPDGVSMHEVISVPRQTFLQDSLADTNLLQENVKWMTSGPTRNSLLQYPTLLAYLGRFSTEGKLAPVIETLMQAKADGTLPEELRTLVP
jgi:hypothetical protein